MLFQEKNAIRANIQDQAQIRNLMMLRPKIESILETKDSLEFYMPRGGVSESSSEEEDEEESEISYLEISRLY